MKLQLGLFLAAAISVASMNASADLFKCKAANGNFYSEQPCLKTEPGQKIDMSRMDTGESMSPQESQDRLAKEKRLARKMEAIRNGEVIIGMTKEEVTRSWGHPTKINRSVGVGYASEQWIYDRGHIGRTQYLYMENGVLRSFQSPGE